MIRALLLVFVSSGSVMVSELVAGRIVAPCFGQSIRTWTALTGVTLLGCTLGNALGAVLSRRSPNRVAGLALAAGGLSLSAVPVLLPWLSPLGLVPAVTCAWIFPSVLLGCVTPAAAAAVVRSERNGRDLSLLYALSMGGALIGSALGGLWLPFAVSADTLYRVLGGLLLAVSPLAFLMRCRAPAGAVQRGDSEPAGRGFAPHVPMLVAVFAVGYVGMAAEMAASKLVIPILGGNHVVWALIISSFIGWMAAGGAVGGRIADRFAHPFVPVVSLGLSALGVALTSVLETRVFTLPDMDLLDVPARMALQIVGGFAPAAFSLGAANTILLKFATSRALARGDRASPGLYYALASAGSVAGTFVTGLWCTGILPGHVMMGVLAVLTASVGVLFARDVADENRQGAVLLAAILAAAALSVTLLSRRPVAHDIVVSGETVVATQESNYNVVSVTVDPARPSSRSIWLDRIQHTTVDEDRPDCLSSCYTTMIDVMLSASNVAHEAVFMIGGGGYALPVKWALQKDPPKKVVVAEIDPVVKEMAFRYLKPKGFDYPDAWEFPVGDGRAVVKALERGTYDVVIGDTISDMTIPYHLVTDEFTAELKGLLKEGGVYLLHVLDEPGSQELAKVLAATLHRSFAHVGGLCFSGLKDRRQSIVLCATDDAAKLDLPAFARALKKAAPESYPHTELYPESADAFVLTDRFAPVERWVWRTITSARMSKAMRLAKKSAEALNAGDLAAARELAIRAMDLDPDQYQAVETLYYWLCEHPEDADALKRLELAASRENPDDGARRFLSRFRKEFAK